MTLIAKLQSAFYTFYRERLSEKFWSQVVCHNAINRGDISPGSTPAFRMPNSSQSASGGGGTPKNCVNRLGETPTGAAPGKSDHLPLLSSQ